MFDVAALEKPREANIVDGESQTNRTDLIVLKGVFSTSDSAYRFEIKSDGTGEIFYSDFAGDSEEFAHEIRVEKLAAEIEEAVKEQIA